MRRFARILLLTYLAYVALVLMVIAPLADHLLGRIYQQQTGRELHYNGVGINPFTMTIYLYNAEDRNPSGTVLWGVEELGINLSLESLLGRGIVLDELLVKSLYVHPQKNRDGRWIFDDILAHRAARAPTAAEKPAAADNSLPAVTIHAIHFNAKHLGYTDLARPEPFEAALEQITISLTDFSTVVSEGHPYHVIAHDEGGGELEWQGTLSLPGKRSKGEIHVRNISLLPVWRFIQSDVNFRLNSAFFQMDGNYRASWENPAVPAFTIDHGHVAFTQVDMSPKQERESGIALEELAINNIRADSVSRHAAISDVQVKSFRGTVSVLKNGKTSFQQMLVPPTTKSAAKPAKPSLAWSYAIDRVHLEKAAFVFNDYSIEPAFSARIQDFSGDILPVSSSPASTTRVKLEGTVDGYAPVTLQGVVKPMAQPPDLDLAFNFRGIELSSFAPYSGTYAGYRIDSGLLTVGLKYRLKDNRIQGSNKVVINQLVLGQRVKSPRLIDLPLRLALALLTDEHGVIDLDVDVSGDTKNPDFSIGKIVWKAFRNIIVKAVTAPFRLLAGLVGSSDDFEFVPFAAGSADMSPEAKAALAKLPEAMAKRPQLRVGVNGIYSEDDRFLLRSRSLHSKFIADGLSQKDIDRKSSAFYRRVAAFYKQAWPNDGKELSAEQQYLALVNAEPNPQLELEKLCDTRALAVKLFLLQELKMDAARVFLDKAPQAEKWAAVKLSVDVTAGPSG